MRKRNCKQKGATLIDYTLIVALISVTSIVALRELGLQAQRPFCQAVEFGEGQRNMSDLQWFSSGKQCFHGSPDAGDDDGMMPG